MAIRKWLLACTLATVVAGSAAAAQHGHGQMTGQGMGGMGMGGMGMMGMGMGMMSGDCPMQETGKGTGGGMMGHMMMADAKQMDTMTDKRLESLKKQLEIGEAQEKAWEAYAKATKDRATTMQGMHQAMMASMKEGKAVDRLEVRISVMANMLDSMKALLPVTKALYEALPGDKKTKADTLLGGCGMM